MLLGKSWGPCASSPPFGSFVLEELGFFLNSPALVQRFREESALQKKKNKLKKKKFCFETIPPHHVQIEVIPMVQMGFGYFSLWITWQS